jgi:hypothetical protein
MSQSPPAASSSPIYQSVFESALEAYRKTTKTDLASHHLLVELESCDSPEAILATLRGQILRFDQARNGNEWLSSTAKELYAFSSTIGGGVGMVRLS